MKAQLALTWVWRSLPHNGPCGPKALLNELLGTTYSCVANYEGTNVEISK